MIVLDKDRTGPSVEAYIGARHRKDGVDLLRYHAGVWWRWEGTSYQAKDEKEVELDLMRFLEKECGVPAGANAQKHFPANPSTTRAIMQTMELTQRVPVLDGEHGPVWLDRRHGDPDGDLGSIVAHPEGWMDLRGGRTIEPTPRLFIQHSVPWVPGKTDGRPDRWLRFLSEIFAGDKQSVRAMWHWFGYCLTADNRYQKALMVIGPMRSGKSTAFRILRDLVGARNVCAPTMHDLAEHFGLHSMVGKSLAICGEMEIADKREGKAACQRIKRTTGQDLQEVHRKHHDSHSVELHTRLVFLANENPDLLDPSGALVKRLIILETKASFVDKEDTDLYAELRDELPAIFDWAVDGLRDLIASGRMAEPSSSRFAREELEENASPMREFIDSRCELGEMFSVPVAQLFDAYRGFLAEGGMPSNINKNAFARELRSVARLESEKQNGIRVYHGIQLRITDASD